MTDDLAESDLPEHVRANREAWDRYATEFVEPGHRSWSTDHVTWGIGVIPESDGAAGAAGAPDAAAAGAATAGGTWSGYSPITLQMKPIEMKKPEKRAIRPSPP
jgi:hypothetical protein